MITKVLFQPVTSILSFNTRLMATTTAISNSDLVLTREVGTKGIIILNRPKALNAVNLGMVDKIAAILRKWQNTKSLIIVKGNGGKAFCAGGDIRSVVQADAVDFGKKMTKMQYTMLHVIGNLKIPYVALMDGITMGGGVGISVHGRYRVATEKTIFAMPETAIGLFPDYGGTHFLPRLQGKLGYYIGLTGTRLKGQDVLHAGIATHFCESAKIPQIENALLEIKNINDVENVLNDLCTKPTTIDQINKTFDATSIEGILNNLDRDGSEWAQQTIKTLRTVSPISLKVTLHQPILGKNFSLGECLQLEFRMAVRFIKDSDFNEGVRALLVRKDNNPKWNPARIEDVTEEKVLSYFRPLPNNEELPINVKLTSKL